MRPQPGSVYQPMLIFRLLNIKPGAYKDLSILLYAKILISLADRQGLYKVQNKRLHCMPRYGINDCWVELRTRCLADGG